jgi:SAM-dependent methyltransferase
VKPGSRTLEAGCGLGRFTVALHALGYRAEGLDWSAETIARLQQSFPAIPWHAGDVRHIDCADGAFDAVYLPGVCEHFEEGPEAILIEMRRVLRSDGIAVVSTPCFNSWLQRHLERQAFSGDPCGEFYQYAFTPDGLALLLGRIGFDVLQVKPYGALETFTRYAAWQIPAGWRRALGVAMDYLPVVREWGSTCIWVARKR